MPIDGLPNPQIHRMCKRCRQWFNAHEVSMMWAPKTGLLTWVHVTMAENMDQHKELKAYCSACQELNSKDETRFSKAFMQSVIMIAIVCGLGLIAWALGLGDLIKEQFSKP